MATGSPPNGFAAGELERIDRALGQLPPAHLLPPRGLRQIYRAPALQRGGRVYPSVLAMFAVPAQAVYFYDAAFEKTDLLELIAHVAVGCSLSADASLFREFSRLIGRADQPSSVMLLEEASLAAAVGSKADGITVVDLLAVPAGIDLGVAYATFLSQPGALKSSAPNVYALVQERLFAPDSVAAAIHEDATATARLQMVRG